MLNEARISPAALGSPGEGVEQVLDAHVRSFVAGRLALGAGEEVDQSRAQERELSLRFGTRPS